MPTNDGTWRLRERVRVTGAEIATDRFGEGPPVVLVHGTPSWSFLWRRVVGELAAEHTVYVWDLPGYGDSVLDHGAPSVAVHARALADLVDRWDIGRPALVGHDIGGATVLRAHLVHDVPADRIALLDAAVLSPWVTPVATHMQQHPDAYRIMPHHIFGEIMASHLRTTTHNRLPGPVVAAYLDRYTGADGQRRYLDKVEHFTEDDTRDVVARLDRIRVPVRVIWGERDQWLEPATASRIADLIPGAEVELIPDAGHFVTEDAPDAVAASLLRFLGRS